MANKILSFPTATARASMRKPFFIGRDYVSTVMSMEPVAYLRLQADPDEYSNEHGVEGLGSFARWENATRVAAPVEGASGALNFTVNDTNRILLGEYDSSNAQSISFWAKRRGGTNDFPQASHFAGYSVTTAGWTHVCVTGGRRYDNGVDVGSVNSNPGYDFELSGIVAEVAIFDRVLTSDEISALYTARTTQDEWSKSIEGSPEIIDTLDWDALGGSDDFVNSEFVEFPARQVGSLSLSSKQFSDFGGPMFSDSGDDDSYVHVEVRDVTDQSWVTLTTSGPVASWRYLTRRDTGSNYFVLDTISIDREIDAIRFRGANLAGGGRGSFHGMERLLIDLHVNDDRFAGRATAKAYETGLLAGKSKFIAGEPGLVDADVPDPTLWLQDVVQVAWVELILPAPAQPEDAFVPPGVLAATSDAHAPEVAAQRLVSVDGELATASAGASTPSVSTSTQTFVQTPVSTGSAESLDPSVTTTSNASIQAEESTAAADMLESSFTGGVAVAGETGVATGAASAPAVSVDARIAGEEATASADTLDPDASGSVVVSATTSTATVGIKSAIVVSEEQGKISPAPASADANALAPDVSVARGVTLEPGTAALASAGAGQPVTSAGASVAPGAIQSEVSGLAPSVVVSADVDAEEAQATADVQEPTIGTGPTRESPSMDASASAQTPDISTQVSPVVEGEVAAADVEAHEPDVSAGATITPPSGRASGSVSIPSVFLGIAIRPLRIPVFARMHDPAAVTVQNVTVQPDEIAATASAQAPEIDVISNKTIFGRTGEVEVDFLDPAFEFTITPEQVDAEILLFTSGTGDTRIGSTSSDVRLGTTSSDATTATT